MDKVAELKNIARGLGAGAIGIGGGVAASHLIQRNKNSARATKGWDTRKKNNLTKVAETDNLGDMRAAVRIIGRNMDNPANAVKSYAARKLLMKIKNIFAKPRNHYYAK